MSDPAVAVRVVGAEEAEDVVEVIAEAFADYPVMKYVLGESQDYAARLRILVGFFVSARILRDELVLAVGARGGLDAAALVSFPGRRTSPPEVAGVREEVWRRLGGPARARYETFGAAAGRFHLDRPQMQLNMAGVRRAARGRGLGRLLLDEVHGRSARDLESTGVSLSTEVVSNVRLYEHFGYRIIGEAEVDGAFTTWVMFREDGAGDGASPTI